jgi:hypothetical protein
MRTQAFILIAAVLAALVIAGEAQIRFPKYQARPAPKGTFIFKINMKRKISANLLP